MILHWERKPRPGTYIVGTESWHASGVTERVRLVRYNVISCIFYQPSQSPSVTALPEGEPNELERALSKAAFGDWGPECCREWDERLHRGE